jgi:hypothetical protein
MPFTRSANGSKSAGWCCLQPGLTRAALHDDRWGHILDALFAAHLNQGVSVVALKALEG